MEAYPCFFPLHPLSEWLGPFDISIYLGPLIQSAHPTPLQSAQAIPPNRSRPCDGTSDWRHINMATILSASAD